MQLHSSTFIAHVQGAVVAMRSTLSAVFGERLKAARLAAGLSQKQLGIQAGLDEFVASPRVNRYENGIHQPDPETLERMADVLGVPVAYLFAMDERLAQLILAFAKLSDKRKDDVLRGAG